jgi:translocation and assembly module TamB
LVQRPKVARPRRRWLKALIFLLAVLGGSMILLNSRFAWEQGCALARRELPSILGMKVGIGRCELDPLSQTVRLYDVSAAAPGGEVGPSFAARLVEVRISSLRPFFGDADIDFVRVSRPRIDWTLEIGEPAPASRARACPLDALSRIHVGSLEVTDGAFRAHFPDGREIQLDGLNVGWLEKRGTAQIEVAGQSGSAVAVAGKELPISGLRLSALLSLRERWLQVSRAEMDAGGARLSIGGRIEELCRPKLKLDAKLVLPLQTLGQAGLVGEGAEGAVAVRAGISGSPSSPVLSAKISGDKTTIGQFHPGTWEARVLLSAGELKLEELLLRAGPGTAKISGSVKLQKSLPARLKADIEGVEFGRVLEMAGLQGAWVDFFATGKVNVAGHLLPAVHLSGEADLKADRFVLASQAFDAPPRAAATILRFDQGRVSLNVRFLSDKVEMQHVLIEAGKTRVSADATLHYHSGRGLHITASANPLVLSDFRRVAGFDANGVGAAEVEISGPFADVRLESTTTFRDLDFWYFSLGAVQGKVRYQKKVLTFAGLSGQKGKTPYTAAGELRFGPSLYAAWDVLVPNGRTEDMIDAIVALHPSIELFQGVSSGRISGSVHIASPVSQLTGSIVVSLADTRYYGRRLGDGKLALRFVDGESMVLDEASLSGPFANLSGSGTYRFDGPLELRFRGDNLSLAELVGVDRARKLSLAGSATLVGKVAGDATTPEVTAYLHAPLVNLGERGSGEAHLEARVLGRQLEVWGRPFSDTRASARIALKEPYPFDASLTLALEEIRPLLPPGAVAQGLSGALEGAVKVKGNLADASSLDLSARIEKLRLSRGDFAGENDEPISFAYRRGRFELDTVTFRGPNTELTFGGWAGPAQVDARLSGSLDVRLLESFIPALDRSGGRLEISATATGAIGDPAILGSAEMRDIRVSLRDFPASLKGVSGKLEFSEARLVLQDVRGGLNDGRVLLRGSLGFQRLAVASYELMLQLDEVGFRPRESLPLTLSGELNLVGKPQALLLSGDLDVLKLRYDQPLAIENFLTQIGGGARSPFWSEKKEEWLSFDVGVHAKGDVRVDNNLARAKLAGDVRLTGTNAQPGLLGTIQALQGSQAFFRGNQFAIRQGVLEFRDRRSIDALFDLQAETQVREYLVRLHGFGRPSDPKLILSAEPELSEGDILSLLTLGITSRDKSNTAATSAGLAAEALFTASGLDRQVQRFLPPNPVLRDFAVRISTSYNEASFLVEPNWQFESKFLTEQLKLRYTQPFSGRGRKAQAEYVFDNRISAQAQWDDADSYYSSFGTGNLSSLGNLGLSLKLHWEVE